MELNLADKIQLISFRVATPKNCEQTGKCPFKQSKTKLLCNLQQQQGN